jgi:hypothetical protein
MPATALQHFQDDISRARAIIDHAHGLPTGTVAEETLRSDILRSGWMFAVGALDAYFCDAYTDIVAATIISKARYPAMDVPEFFQKIKFPVRAFLEQYDVNENWRWRMAARELMVKENVLSLETIQALFKKFLRPQHRFFQDVLDSWITHPNAKRRVFGITRAAYIATPVADREAARKAAWERMDDRYEEIFQRRHDCIHNCDRPRVAPQPLNRRGTVLKVIEDVEFLVERSDEHIQVEFREFLLGCHCPPAIVAQAGY